MLYSTLYTVLVQYINYKVYTCTCSSSLTVLCTNTGNRDSLSGCAQLFVVRVAELRLSSPQDVLRVVTGGDNEGQNLHGAGYTFRGGNLVNSSDNDADDLENDANVTTMFFLKSELSVILVTDNERASKGFRLEIAARVPLCLLRYTCQCVHM